VRRNVLNASDGASTQRSAVSEFDSRQASTLRLYTSRICITYRNPCAIGRYVTSNARSWFGRSDHHLAQPIRVHRSIARGQARPRSSEDRLDPHAPPQRSHVPPTDRVALRLGCSVSFLEPRNGCARRSSSSRRISTSSRSGSGRATYTLASDGPSIPACRSGSSPAGRHPPLTADHARRVLQQPRLPARYLDRCTSCGVAISANVFSSRIAASATRALMAAE